MKYLFSFSFSAENDKQFSFSFRAENESSFSAENESSFSAPFSFSAENVKPVFGRSLSKTVSCCFNSLRQIRSIRRSVSRPVLLSLVTSLVLTRLDYGSATLADVSGRLLDRLQSVLNAAARLVCDSRKYDHISPLLCDLHWLRVPDRIKFRLAVLTFRCRSNTAPAYLSRDLHWAADSDARRRLRSSSSNKLVVPRTRLKTVGDRAFGTAAARIWNDLPPTITNVSSISAFCLTSTLR